jgi:putative tryptophan/tyrosine transport system substrate-binding protein
MSRREFITLAGTSALWPLAVSAQQPIRVMTIGILGAATPAANGQFYAEFEKRLQELGWMKGRNLAIEYRWAQSRVERYNEIAAEFVRLNVDAIVTNGTAPVIALKQATSKIPVIFAAAGDPIGNKLVTSLSRPGANITGLSIQQPDTAGKRLELLREVIPNLQSLAVIANVDTPGAMLEKQEAEATARKLGLEVVGFDVRKAEDIAAGFEYIKDRAQALYICTDPLLFTNKTRINTLALSARLATIQLFREYVEAGGLMSYGPNFPDLFRRAADFVDKILRGAKPADIPVEQPAKFDLVINLTTAKALGLTVPPSLLATADEIIE